MKENIVAANRWYNTKLLILTKLKDYLSPKLNKVELKKISITHCLIF